MCEPLSGYYSEMWKFYFGVFAIWPLVSAAESSLLYKNGWMPVSSDTVYNQFKRERIQVPSYTASHNIQAINTDINKILSPEKKYNIYKEIADEAETNIEAFGLECATEGVTICLDKEIKSNPVVELEHFVPNSFYPALKQDNTADKSTRRSKKIADFNFKNYVQQILLNENESTTKSKSKSYEVTESDIEGTVEQEESETKDTGYQYEPPNKQNLTNGLFEILSKYKISKDDELPNYALSRRQKTSTPLKQNLPIKPFRNQILHKYNNLNHLPVDPLLAVFLSNYGYYLQGMYGIHNHYNNLYGYLASNNIHNNRPFGFYKVFSDTDSSN